MFPERFGIVDCRNDEFDRLDGLIDYRDGKANAS
jgi:hypothetical protein